MKTILLPEQLLLLFNISKVHWPKVLCLVSFIKRNSNGKIFYEYFEFIFHGILFSVERTYNSKGICLTELVRNGSKL